MFHFFRPDFLLCIVLATLAIYPIVVESACGIAPPGKPLVDGVPQCPCGYLYVSSVNCIGTIPTQCSICDSRWTSVGCYPTNSTVYHSNTTNIRCNCSIGDCCITSGSKSGMFQPSGYVCNAGTACANATKCSGTSADCPERTFMPSSTVCRPATGPCQNDAKCTGSSPSCPLNTFKPSSTVCAASTGPCQNDAKCTGSTPPCPTRTFKLSSTVCQAASGPCQNDAKCTGSTALCPARTFKQSTTMCSASIGTCENPSYCTGKAATCPTKTLKPPTTVCRTPRGPCENSAYCLGNSTACPRPSFKSNTTICEASGENCFLDAVCPGNGPRCTVNAARPEGSICGNNTACSRFTNNKCNAIGDCLVAECTSCPNGKFGSDCSCPGGPPTSSVQLPLNATCSVGVWTINGDITGSLVIEPGTVVVIEGSLMISHGDSLTLGSGSYANVSGCSNITGSLKGKYSKLVGTKEAEFELVSPECSFVDVVLVTVASSDDKCQASTVKKSPGGPELIGLLFDVRNTCNKKNLLAYIVAPTVSVGCVAILLGVALFLVKRHYDRSESKYAVAGDIN